MGTRRPRRVSIQRDEGVASPPKPRSELSTLSFEIGRVIPNAPFARPRMAGDSRRSSYRDPACRRRVCAALCAAADRSRGLRRRAACFACRDNARRDAALRPSRFRARVVARDRLRDGARRRLLWPFAVSRRAFLRVAAEVLPAFGVGSFTPERRASDNPIAIACLVERAPWRPCRM